MKEKKFNRIFDRLFGRRQKEEEDEKRKRKENGNMYIGFRRIICVQCISQCRLFSDSKTVQNALVSEMEDVFSDGSDSDVFVSDETKDPAGADSAGNASNVEDTITQDGIVYERGTYSVKVIGYTDELKSVSKITIPAYVGELRASLIWNTSTSHHP